MVRTKLFSKPSYDSTTMVFDRSTAFTTKTHLESHELDAGSSVAEHLLLPELLLSCLKWFYWFVDLSNYRFFSNTVPWRTRSARWRRWWAGTSAAWKAVNSYRTQATVSLFSVFFEATFRPLSGHWSDSGLCLVSHLSKAFWMSFTDVLSTLVPIKADWKSLCTPRKLIKSTKRVPE